MACRKCKWLDVKPNKNGRISPRKGNIYRCLYPVGSPPPLPASIPVNPAGFSAMGLTWPPAKQHMEPGEGDNCPVMEPRS